MVHVQVVSILPLASKAPQAVSTSPKRERGLAMNSLLDRYRDKIRGVISCYDRVIIRGTLPGLCYAGGMTSYLNAHKIRIFDYPRWAEPLRDEIKANTEKIASETGLEIEFIRKAKSFRKEDRIKEIIRERGDHPGLVHVFSAMEICDSYKPWHDKKSGQTFLKPDSGKCLHYYFYFIDEKFGLCHLRVPTWAPFRLQMYFNGHSWLANRLVREGVRFKLIDNAFTEIDDFARAQNLSDKANVKELHEALDRFAGLYCPVIKDLEISYHWSLSQVEYATDVVFKRQEDLHDLYSCLILTAIHAVHPDQVATFLGRKLTSRYEGEVGNNFSTRIEGTRIRHQMGPASLKMYDKFGLILRIETTTYDVAFFKHHRMVEQRNGQSVFKLAQLKRSIYSLEPDLMNLMAASNRRYLAFLSDLDDPTAGMKALDKISESVCENERMFRGYNLFREEDQILFENILRGEYMISGMRNKNLRSRLKKSSQQVSYALKRLRVHGLIKRLGKTYKYYITEFGRRVAILGLKLKELYVIPTLAQSLAC